MQFTLVFRIEFASLQIGVHLRKRVVLLQVDLHPSEERRVDKLLGLSRLHFFVNHLVALQSEDFFCGLQPSDFRHFFLLHISGGRVLTKKLRGLVKQALRRLRLLEPGHPIAEVVVVEHSEVWKDLLFGLEMLLLETTDDWISHFGHEIDLRRLKYR